MTTNLRRHPDRIGMRDRVLWPLDLGMLILAVGAAYCVFRVTGGDWRRPLDNLIPVTAAVYQLAAVTVIAWSASFGARIVERRRAAREDEIRAAELPLRLESPYALQFAERAVIVAAFNLATAQIPTEHPEENTLVDAVAMLRRSIEQGDSVHPDVRRIYQRSTRRGRTRAAVEQVVRQHGPIMFPDILDRLAMGGSWGEPMNLSGDLVRRLLHDADNPNRPAPWLAPREIGERYQHRDNLADATPAER